MVMMLTGWLICAPQADCQAIPQPSRFPSINLICEAVGASCNTGLTMSGCPDACMVGIDTEFIGASASSPSCEVGGSGSNLGICNSCEYRTETRKLDFDGRCSKQYLEFFLQQTSSGFLSGLAALSQAQCKDVSDGNEFSERFLTEIRRIFCGASGMPPRSVPIPPAAATPDPGRSPPVSTTSPPSSSSSPPSRTRSPRPPRTSPPPRANPPPPRNRPRPPRNRPRPPRSRRRPPRTRRRPPRTRRRPPRTRRRPPRPRPRPPRPRPRPFSPGGLRGRCVNEIRRCLGRENVRDPLRAGARNRLVSVCCVRFCRCRREASLNCVRGCTSLF